MCIRLKLGASVAEVAAHCEAVEGVIVDNPWDVEQFADWFSVLLAKHSAGCAIAGPASPPSPLKGDEKANAATENNEKSANGEKDCCAVTCCYHKVLGN